MATQAPLWTPVLAAVVSKRSPAIQGLTFGHSSRVFTMAAPIASPVSARIEVIARIFSVSISVTTAAKAVTAATIPSMFGNSFSSK